MLEADKKRKENIVEYLLFMFHTLDIIRSCQLNLEAIEKRVVNPTKPKPEEKAELMRWYTSLVETIESEGIEDRGIPEELKERIGELSYLHRVLTNVLQRKDYIELWEKALPNLVELEQKAGGAAQNPIELALNAVYGILVLRIKKQEISPETIEAVQTFTSMLAYLAKSYNELRDGTLRLPNTLDN